jgi:uncharacterized repeat protein (TIGR01451 family)
MAIFSNQATLTFNGIATNSNLAFGELLDVLAITKTAVEGTYTPDGLVTYVVTLRNTGTTPLTAITLTDDLGGYVFEGTTVYPLAYEAGSVTLFVDGAPQPAPAVTAGPPLVITGLTIPAGGDTVVVYQARTTAFAPPSADSTITNTVTAAGDGLSADPTASETVAVTATALLSITKSITPAQVVDNDRVTYTFVIQNRGNEAVLSTDNAVITDTFNPILSALTVSYNGEAWTEGVEYTYNDLTGEFTTLPGALPVPAATFTQDPVSGAYTTTPGIATLTISGTI